jgi:hypothetical protein
MPHPESDSERLPRALHRPRRVDDAWEAVIREQLAKLRARPRRVPIRTTPEPPREPADDPGAPPTTA